MYWYIKVLSFHSLGSDFKWPLIIRKYLCWLFVKFQDINKFKPKNFIHSKSKVNNKLWNFDQICFYFGSSWSFRKEWNVCHGVHGVCIIV